jgi:hypothetical protein
VNSVQREAASGALLPDKVFALWGLLLRFAQRTKPQSANTTLIPGNMPRLLFYEQNKFLLSQPLSSMRKSATHFAYVQSAH